MTARTFTPFPSCSTLTVLDIRHAADADTAQGVRRLAIKYGLLDVEVRLIAQSEYLDRFGRPLPQAEVAKAAIKKSGA